MWFAKHYRCYGNEEGCVCAAGEPCTVNFIPGTNPPSTNEVCCNMNNDQCTRALPCLQHVSSSFGSCSLRVVLCSAAQRPGPSMPWH